MSALYPVLVEREESGAFSAYVPGLPVYAAADTQRQAERALRDVLAAYLDAHPSARSRSTVRVARAEDDRRVRIVGVGALLGAETSQRKARSSRANGRLGGRPRKTA